MMFAQAHSARPRRRAAAGLTLLETLVALAIASLVVAVLAHALGQANRIEQQLSTSSLQFRTVQLRTEWLRLMLESILPLPENERDQFQGDATAMRGLSSQVPSWPESAAAPFLLEIVPLQGADAYELTLRTGPSQAGSAAGRIVLLSWQGGRGRFTYLTEEGEWADRWPVQKPSPGRSQLPRAIAVVTEAQEASLIVAAPLSWGIPKLRRTQLERL